MARPLKLKITETLEELKTLLGQQKTAQGKERVQAIYLLKLGQVKTVSELATVLGRHRLALQEWLATYRQGGMTALLTYKSPPGRQGTIPAWAVKALNKRLQDPAGFRSYQAVQEWLKDTLGIVASYQAVYNLVHYKLKAELKVARRKSRDQDSEQLEQFKINLAADLSLLKEFCQTHLGEVASRIRYWCQDETRWSLTAISRRLLTAFGIKPIGMLQWECLGFWLYGLVEMLTGEQFVYEFSHLDSVCFQQFINQFAAEYPQEFHILHLNRASAHIAKRIRLPKNVMLLFQPSHCPELNPNLKEFISWDLFSALDALSTKVRELLEDLTQEVVTSLTGWNYIIDTLFVADIS